MNLRQLEIFSTVIQEGSFTGAAKKLNMAQPAVSIAIRKLEELLELKLIQRADDITVTAEGKILLEHAHQLLHDMSLAKQAMTDLHELKTGMVRLSTSPILGNYFFPEKIQIFRERYPNIDFQIHNQKTISTRHQLDTQQCDLAIVDMDKLPKDLDAIFLSEQEVVACMSNTNPLAKTKKTLAISEFLKQPLALYRQDHTLRTIVDEECEKRGLNPKIVMESDLTGMILKTIRYSDAVGLCMGTVHEQESDLKIIPFKHPIMLHIGVGWKKSSYLSAANRAFVDFLKGG